MKKSGLNKSYKLSGTDISLIIIVAFCSLVVVFIGYRCCQRKRAKRKNKAAQRKIPKRGNRRENGDLLGTTSQASDESLDPEGQNSNTTSHPSFELRPTNNKKHSGSSPQNQNRNNSTTPSFLHRIMSSLRGRDSTTPDSEGEGTGKTNSLGASTSKQGSPGSRRNKKKGKTSPDSDGQQDSDIPGQTQGRETRSKTRAKSDSSIMNCSRTPTQDDPLSSSAKQSGQLCGIGSKGSNRKGSIGKKTCKKKCTGSSCTKCGAFKDNDGGAFKDNDGGAFKDNDGGAFKDNDGGAFKDNDGNHGGDYEVLARVGTVEVKHSKIKIMVNPGKSSGKHATQFEKERRDEDSIRRVDGDGVMASRTTGEANPEKDSVATQFEDSKTVKPGIRRSLDDDPNGYDMCSDIHNNGALQEDSKMEVDYENISTQITEAINDDDHMSEETNRDIGRREKDGFEDQLTRKEALLRQSHDTGGVVERHIESVGEVYNVVQYARNEWKSDTATAKAVREGYFQIPQQLALNNLRVIRGDNYCAIRATLFQVLAKKIPILSKLGQIEQIPEELMNRGCEWIEEWNFGSRLPVRRDKVCEEMKVCLKELANWVHLIAQMDNEEGRVSHLLSHFNFKPLEFEIRLLEAVKFLMLYRAIQLHRKIRDHEDVPIFAMIMFARDSSHDPWHFMAKHLNAVGDTGGLEQVEMHLLGYTLGVTIKVVRPSHFGQSDFIASYPDDMPNCTPVVTLVAEDDRHYNILS